jgi:enterochelin esterase-like enzyme
MKNKRIGSFGIYIFMLIMIPYQYTPPAYNLRSKNKYPVLYLLRHGIGNNENGWIETGKANRIDRAFAGLSMGGRQILAVSLANLYIFFYNLLYSI